MACRGAAFALGIASPCPADLFEGRSRTAELAFRNIRSDVGSLEPDLAPIPLSIVSDLRSSRANRRGIFSFVSSLCGTEAVSFHPKRSFRAQGKPSGWGPDAERFLNTKFVFCPESAFREIPSQGEPFQAPPPDQNRFLEHRRHANTLRISDSTECRSSRIGGLVGEQLGQKTIVSASLRTCDIAEGKTEDMLVLILRDPKTSAEETFLRPLGPTSGPTESFLAGTRSTPWEVPHAYPEVSGAQPKSFDSLTPQKPSIEASQPAKGKIFVCTKSKCCQQGALNVLAALKESAPEDVRVREAGCLGKCGKGPVLRLVQPGQKPQILTKVKSRNAMKFMEETFKPSQPELADSGSDEVAQGKTSHHEPETPQSGPQVVSRGSMLVQDKGLPTDGTAGTSGAPRSPGLISRRKTSRVHRPKLPRRTNGSRPPIRLLFLDE